MLSIFFSEYRYISNRNSSIHCKGAVPTHEYIPTWQLTGNKTRLPLCIGKAPRLSIDHFVNVYITRGWCRKWPPDYLADSVPWHKCLRKKREKGLSSLRLHARHTYTWQWSVSLHNKIGFFYHFFFLLKRLPYFFFNHSKTTTDFWLKQKQGFLVVYIFSCLRLRAQKQPSGITA